MIYYSHVNEDNRVERDLFFNHNKSPTLMAISGSGERIISLLDASHLREIYAIDANPEAQFLLQLKLLALERLALEEYLFFIGATGPSSDLKHRRIIAYQKLLRNYLTPEALSFWDQRQAFIEEGILTIGHFEKFLGRLRPILRIFLGSNFYKLLTVNYSSAQIQSIFPKHRFNFILKIFSFALILKLFGNRDQAFIGDGAKLSRMAEGLKAIIENDETPYSYMFHLIFKGTLELMETQHLPPSLNPIILTKIKKRLQNKEIIIKYLTGDLLQIIPQLHLPPDCFFSLSDILSFVDHHYLQQLLLEISRKVPSPGLVIRAFLRNDLSDADLESLPIKLVKINLKESTRMYSVFTIKAPL